MVHNKEYKKKVKQLAIIEAAKQLFFEKKYNSITVDEIAKLAGLTKKTLYTYFPSKLSLYTKIFEDYLQSLHAEFSACLMQDLPPHHLILAAFDTIYKFSKNNEKFMHLFWQISSEDFGGDIPEELINRINFWNRSLINELLAVTSKAIDEGYIIDIDPELLGHTFSAFNKGIFMHTSKESKFHIADISPDQLYETFVKVITSGLFNK